MIIMKTILALIMIFLMISCGSNSNKEHERISNKTNPDEKPYKNQVLNSTVSIINKIPHDPLAYTQGLVYHKGFLYESTGHRGASTLRKIDPNTGEIIKKIPVSGMYFSEGICIFENMIYMITWTSGKCFVYDLETFERIKEMDYNGQGWGLANYGNKFLMSDGSNILRMIEPSNFFVEKNTSVVDENFNPISYLNEMENIKGEIWANIWMQDKIARINPDNGNLIGWVDLSNLREFVTNPEQEVSNGIAFNEEENAIYLTGKNWEYIFVVQIVDGITNSQKN
jgi:glutamine cyclotransferase